jgi:hypothetical protein
MKQNNLTLNNNIKRSRRKSTQESAMNYSPEPSVWAGVFFLSKIVI